MQKLPIFKGLNLTVTEAQDLATYWRVAGDKLAIIDSKGMLTTAERTWERPMSQKNFENLQKHLNGCEVPWIIVQDNQIVVDFSKLQYNVDWIREICQKHQLGVCDSKDGLKLYQRKKSNEDYWYVEQSWQLKGVSVAKLGFERNEVVNRSPNQQNPRTAAWAKLYFAD